LDIATGRKSAIDALEDIVTKVPWDDLEMMDVSVKEFFAEGEFYYYSGTITQSIVLRPRSTAP
jgi:hypothetical protein